MADVYEIYLMIDYLLNHAMKAIIERVIQDPEVVHVGCGEV